MEGPWVEENDFQNTSLCDFRHIFKPFEFFITTDHFPVWRRHLAWSKGGKDLRTYVTARMSSNMVVLTLLLSTLLAFLYDSGDVPSTVRNQLYATNVNSLGYWIGIVVLINIFTTVYALIANFTAWGMVTSIAEANVTPLMRSPIGQYSVQLATRLVLVSLLLFLLWCSLFVFYLLSLASAIVFVTVSGAFYFHMVSAYTSLGRTILYCGAMEGSALFTDDELEKLMPQELHKKLLDKSKKQAKKGMSVPMQYEKGHLRRWWHAIFKNKESGDMDEGPDDRKKLEKDLERSPQAEEADYDDDDSVKSKASSEEEDRSENKERVKKKKKKKKKRRKSKGGEASDESDGDGDFFHDAEDGSNASQANEDDHESKDNDGGGEDKDKKEGSPLHKVVKKVGDRVKKSKGNDDEDSDGADATKTTRRIKETVSHTISSHDANKESDSCEDDGDDDDEESEDTETCNPMTRAAKRAGKTISNAVSTGKASDDEGDDKAQDGEQDEPNDDDESTEEEDAPPGVTSRVLSAVGNTISYVIPPAPSLDAVQNVAMSALPLGSDDKVKGDNGDYEGEGDPVENSPHLDM